MNIPSEIRAALAARERKARFRKLAKASLFYLAAAALCYLIASQEGSKFSPTTQPIAFWAIVAVLIVAPLVRYRVWRLLIPAEQHGTVVKLKNCSVRVPRTDRNVGYVQLRDMIPVDACEVLWTGENGVSHAVTVACPERASHARAYYQVGDRVTVLRCAAVPFNEDRLPPHPICLGCGFVAKDHEEYCGVCGLALLQERADENAELDASEAVQSDASEFDESLWESKK